MENQQETAQRKKKIQEKQKQLSDFMTDFLAEGFQIYAEPYPIRIATKQGYTIHWGARIMLAELSPKIQKTNDAANINDTTSDKSTIASTEHSLPQG